MNYQSGEFLLFSGIVLILYYLFGKKGQKWVLMFANLAFFLIAGGEYLPYILATMLVTFFTAKGIGNIYAGVDAQLAACETAAEKKALRAKGKADARRLLQIALLVSIGLLAVCKYTTFVLTNVNLLLERISVAQISMFRMVLPIGISFYTFMAVSYVLDVYWKRYEAERDFVMFAAYLAYFPHVVQGPIDRFNRFKAQLAGGIALKEENLAFGAQLAIWGFFKKIVVADRLALLVNQVYGSWEDYSGAVLVLATLLYSIQIYTDFSGCIDIVSGISEMFGIKLDKNFNHPYFAKTMPEFWRRWHMSLGEWFKDYVYYPVSTSAFMKKVKKWCKAKGNKRLEEIAVTCIPAFVVWCTTGIWHGADWKYIFWGLYHAMLIILGNIFDPFNQKLAQKLGIRKETFSWGLFQMSRTFLLCGIGRVFFRAARLSDAFAILGKIFTDFDLSAILTTKLFTYGLVRTDFILSMACILVLWGVDMLQERMPVRQTLARQSLPFRWLVIYAGFFAVLIFGMYGPGYNASDFIYGQF